MSSDELGDFDTQSPQVGPSASNTKRKRVPDSKKGTHIATIKKNVQRIEDPTEVSSDNEPQPPQQTRRGRGASTTTANGHGNGRSVSSKRKVDHSKPELIATEGVDNDEDIAEENMLLSKAEKRRTMPLASLQRRYDDVVKQRDEFASQFEQLYRLRHTETEKLFQEQKRQFEVKLQAQQEMILEQQALINQQKDPENSKNVQRDVTKLTTSLKEKEAALSVKDREIAELNKQIDTLRSDLQQEIENSKRLAARTGPHSLSKTSGKLDARNALIVRLYEELTGILITNVKHDTGKFKDDDAIFSCVQTARNNAASLHFTLKCTTVSDMDTVSEKVIYTPIDLEKESVSFIEQLDFLAKPFTFERNQMQVFFQTLTSHIENNPADDTDTSRMED